MTVLFIGYANAARSPLAEALARQAGHDAYSAGVRPSNVRPEVRTTLEEIGVDANGLRAKGITEIPMDEVELVVALDREAPRIPGGAKRIEWLIPDPSSAPASERAEAFRAARDELQRRIAEWRR